MIGAWASIEADWDALYDRDLTDDLIVRRRSWRWFRTRLVGLLNRDTPTATLWSKTDGPGFTGASPEAVGDVLAGWANE